MEHKNAKVGQQVLFGRAHGEKTLGVIVKINPFKLKVKQLEARGCFRDYPIGTLWSVPAEFCSVTNESAPLLPVTAPVRRKRRSSPLSRENRAMARAENR